MNRPRAGLRYIHALCAKLASSRQVSGRYTRLNRRLDLIALGYGMRADFRDYVDIGHLQTVGRRAADNPYLLMNYPRGFTTLGHRNVGGYRVRCGLLQP